MIVMKVGSVKSHLFSSCLTVRWTVRTRLANDGLSFKMFPIFASFFIILFLDPDL